MRKRRKEQTEKNILVARRASAQEPVHMQCFSYQPQSERDTIATVLLHLQQQNPLRTAEGDIAEPIRWECGCLQKKCGACALRVNGRPALACDAKLCDLPETITLTPLQKFPLVADLLVDRSILQEQLRDLRVWLEQEAKVEEKDVDNLHEASLCLQCGLCLEVCPNVDLQNGFVGAAAAVPATRIMTLENDAEKSALRVNYRRHFFAGCGKSLACEDLCPAGIRTGERMAQSNALAVWNKKQKQGGNSDAAT